MLVVVLAANLLLENDRRPLRTSSMASAGARGDSCGSARTRIVRWPTLIVSILRWTRCSRGRAWPPAAVSSQP